MNTQENISEIQHWDRIALQREDRFADVFSLKNYLAKQDLVWRKIHQMAFGLCGDLTGQRVLDLGCGRGYATMFLAQLGAQVTSLDISPEMVAVTLDRAKKAGCADHVSGAVGTLSTIANELGGPFDLVFAGAVLHHLPDFEQDMALLHQMTRAGGRLIAYDPYSSSIFDFARNHLPYTGKHRSENEAPLNSRHYQCIGALYGGIELHRFAAFTAMERLLMTNSESMWKAFSFLDKLLIGATDDAFCWHAVCVATKRN